MASSSSSSTTSRQRHVPLPPVPGDGNLDSASPVSSVPIHIVTSSAQLPTEFLEPSPERKLAIGFDCEGVDLCRSGKLCIMQLAFPDAIYLVDTIEGDEMLMKACKPALESEHITKVIHDCKRDSEALYFQYGIKLNNVVDTQIAYSLIEEQEGKKKVPDDYISFVGLLADPRYCGIISSAVTANVLEGSEGLKVNCAGFKTLSCPVVLLEGISYQEKEEVRILLRQDPNFWTVRPLSDMMIRAAADDVRFLLYVYHKMMKKLNPQSLWYMAVRGALYCRCFCINNNNYEDWPALPKFPDGIIATGTSLEEEILSILDVPPGKMGRVIGRRGASIMAIKESCNAEIFIGGDKGPPNKVFIIGPVKQVRKAEAILRGRMLNIY